ncbi:hypothetical protein Avbf_06328 [Armadillidium vulgare]|nr:hypothetical protein Avbf_06328 [Armadillidium vulgare]
MKLLIILFLSICVYVSSDQKIESYCEPSDDVCMKAWMKCHGEQMEGTFILLQKVFWGTEINIANVCLKKYGEEPIGITIPNEDPHGGAPGGSDQFHGILQLRLKKIANPERVVNVGCCYAEESNFLMNKTKINEEIFNIFIRLRFQNETQMLEIGSLP